MDYQTIVIKWHGPVSWDALENMEGGGLYAISGTQKYQRGIHVQYIGITEQKYTKRFDRRHKVNLITRNLNIWVGTVIHPIDLARAGLERAESMLIYILNPPLNEKKRFQLPHPTTIISHWFNEKDKARYKRQSIFKHLPDVVFWDGSHWREGNLKVWDSWY